MLRFFIVYGRPAIYVTGSGPEACWAWQRGADRFERDSEALSDILQSGGDSIALDAAELPLNIVRTIHRHGKPTAAEAEELACIARLDEQVVRERQRLSDHDNAARQAAADRVVQGRAGDGSLALPPEMLEAIL